MPGAVRGAASREGAGFGWTRACLGKGEGAGGPSLSRTVGAAMRAPHMASGLWLIAAGDWRGLRGQVGEARFGRGCASYGVASQYVVSPGAPSCVAPSCL